MTESEKWRERKMGAKATRKKMCNCGNPPTLRQMIRAARYGHKRCPNCGNYIATLPLRGLTHKSDRQGAWMNLPSWLTAGGR